MAGETLHFRNELLSPRILTDLLVGRISLRSEAKPRLLTPALGLVLGPQGAPCEYWGSERMREDRVARTGNTTSGAPRGTGGKTSSWRGCRAGLAAAPWNWAAPGRDPKGQTSRDIAGRPGAGRARAEAGADKRPKASGSPGCRKKLRQSLSTEGAIRWP